MGECCHPHVQSVKRGGAGRVYRIIVLKIEATPTVPHTTARISNRKRKNKEKNRRHAYTCSCMGACTWWFIDASRKSRLEIPSDKRGRGKRAQGVDFPHEKPTSTHTLMNTEEYNNTTATKKCPQRAPKEWNDMGATAELGARPNQTKPNQKRTRKRAPEREKEYK